MLDYYEATAAGYPHDADDRLLCLCAPAHDIDR